ncbi:putative Glycosyltransferase family 92 [Helianthus annuus]|uniref:Glycosyltransferase family 92 protein n=1 Tax=Helianthus annuus TaxID=4232 RepID=A0A251UAV2_HELAN|nr:galactan beta-1,4-galactosyltransferase GALS3 [Helianthus annuus]KAF5798216.1 putative Glycosyltransferase family 92 [Helianthus annuus]KAJ0549847.1 putative Glycosyltransferase family 92 [Helianthus annuus]KAJ0556375.1 putative Glycosyltransferase family 92 [Helianthus annuus]KAJ0562805.1 putative Glycosyltransferase family 92 [Helianthus annuus]KAJ0728180.1 putative Glycosyltransferase family 92 [Helianthus annuus]
MAKVDEQIQINSHKHKKMFIGVVWNCPGEIKLLLSALLFLCSIISVFQFFPSYIRDLRDCAAVPPPSTVVELLATSAPRIQNKKLDDVVLEGGVIKRNFKGYGSAAYNFILMSAYRGGGDTFAVVGLSSKPLHLFARPTYVCEWVPHPATGNNKNISVVGYKILPDWGYGRVYTVVVVNCTFPFPVGEDGSGGQLLVHTSTSGGGDTDFNVSDTVEALVEAPGSFHASQLDVPPKYEYLYCGSPLYGDLSPQRVREWIAYHVNLFGERSHFVIHDAGGVHRDVMEVLRPWIEKGYVTLQDIKEEERFDGYYHNQFLVVNDCLHRYRFIAKWMFFFDVDEFIYVPKETTIKDVTDSLLGYTQFSIEQRTMSNKLCYLDDDPGKIYRKWGIEKMVYKDTKRGIRRDRKYAIQPRNVFATGVHMSQNLMGRTMHKMDGKITYYHYHGTISERREPCRQLVNTTTENVDGTPYVVDTTMREVAGAVKRFELRTIGPVLLKTRQ